MYSFLTNLTYLHNFTFYNNSFSTNIFGLLVITYNFIFLNLVKGNYTANTLLLMD